MRKLENGSKPRLDFFSGSQSTPQRHRTYLVNNFTRVVVVPGISSTHARMDGGGARYAHMIRWYAGNAYTSAEGRVRHKGCRDSAPRPRVNASSTPQGSPRRPRRKNALRRSTRRAGSVERRPLGDELLHRRDGGGSPGWAGGGGFIISRGVSLTFFGVQCLQ